MITRELLFRKTALPAVAKSLDAGMLRSKAIANNIANVDVPGYQRAEVDFERQLSKALDKSKLRGDKTNKAHLDIGRRNIEKVKPEAYRPVDPSLPSGVNNVDIDIENAKMAENQILFNFGVKFANARFTAVQQSIKGSAR
ncbi:MAG: flagellar basal body rod protein FlgB [Fibrobacteres bacterium]|nr:flagellar basal body rod protein FlgB [Fibrobacterota bacterium]